MSPTSIIARGFQLCIRRQPKLKQRVTQSRRRSRKPLLDRHRLAVVAERQAHRHDVI